MEPDQLFLLSAKKETDSKSRSHSDPVMKCRHIRKAIGIFILQLFLFPWRANTVRRS